MRVSIAKCNNYDRETVYEAMKGVLAPLGGIGAFVKPGMRVYLKPNVLAMAAPEEAMTTHPEAVGAVARLAREAGAAEVLIGDCPGSMTSSKDEAVMDIYRGCGYDKVAEREGARLVVNTTKVTKAVPGGRAAKSFDLVDEMLGADLLINMSKAKTHALCTFTGAVKNLYGTIYGRDKAKYHAIYRMPRSFNEFLIDIAETVKPGLSIMDAVVGMEGPGPSAGSPRKVGALLASASPYALDAVAVSLIGWKQSDVMLLGLARKRGLLPEKLEDIEVLGVPAEKLRLKKPFAKPTIASHAAQRFSSLLPKTLREAMHPHPVLNNEMCKGCAMCAEACPPHAIKMVNRNPVIDYNACIRCFCCQELCPEKAMEARKGIIKK